MPLALTSTAFLGAIVRLPFLSTRDFELITGVLLAIVIRAAYQESDYRPNVP